MIVQSIVVPSQGPLQILGYFKRISPGASLPVYGISAARQAAALNANQKTETKSGRNNDETSRWECRFYSRRLLSPVLLR